jgi:hypothetical protein
MHYFDYFAAAIAALRYAPLLRCFSPFAIIDFSCIHAMLMPLPRCHADAFDAIIIAFSLLPTPP